ncbi:MAG: TonB-dependent receptor [Sphingomonadales bacterium]|jgi:iron complex outermembrane receptor protein
MKTMRLALTCSSLLAMLAAAMPATAAEAAAADAATAADGEGLAEIVVTAQKRRENLQTTPIAIAVLGNAALTDRHVVSLVDLGDGAIPSLKVAPFFSRPGALVMNIRGVGVMSDSNQPARDQGVGVYVDGVYLGRAQGLGTALYDVENLEVLKGPQGTLFGRNTEGGAINIVTKKPSGQFKFNTTAGLGNFGSYNVVSHIDLPEFAGISIKFDGVVTAREGMVKNPFAGASDFNSYDKRGFRVEALWKPTSSLSVDLTMDNGYDATSTLYQQLISAPTGLAATATGPAIPPNFLAAINPVQPTRASVATVGVPQQLGIGKSEGYRLGLDWEVSPTLTFKSITAYRVLYQSQYDNGSATPTLSIAPTTANPNGDFSIATSGGNYQFGRYSLAPFRQNQISQEFQAIGEFDRVKFSAGALFFQEKVQDSAQAFNTMQVTNAAGTAFAARQIDYLAQVVQRASYVKVTSYGLYGQGTYTPPIANDILHLTLGGRWTQDQKQGNLFTINGALPVVPVNGVNVSGKLYLDRTWKRFDPMINLAVDLSDDIHAYGKWSTGYRSGGASSRSITYRSFDPETLSMFEIGFKSEFFDRRVRFNAAAYTGAYKNIQLDFSGLYEDVVNGVRVATTRTTTDIVNAPGTGRVKGVELELLVNPAQGLTLSGSFAHNEVTIPPTLNPFPQTGGVLITVPLPIYQVYTPMNTASAAIDYDLPLKNATLHAHLDANYDSGVYANYTDVAYDPVTRAVRYPQPKGDAGFIVNGRIALGDIKVPNSDAKLTVALWARNLFNEQHLFYKTGSPQGGVQGFFNDFRTYGIEANVKF